MKLKQLAFLFLSCVCITCADNYGCVERVTVPDSVLKNGNEFTFEPSYWIDLPCDYDTSTLLDVSDVLQNFSYEIVHYKYTSDTGNTTSKLEFEIVLKNNNSFGVEGLPIFLMRADGVEFNASYTSKNVSCSSIASNGSCTLKYDKTTTLDLNKIKSLEIVSIKYLLYK
jgi:hypothetical protein